MAPTDRQLVERVLRGDREAYGDLMDRYRDMVYGLCFHLTHDFEAARDLAQQAFVHAYVKLAQLRDPEKFPAWLRQITTNLHRGDRRRKGVPVVPLSEAQVAPDVGGCSEIEFAVRRALMRLRGPERLALTLHYVNGYSHAEIGEFLGVRRETVKTRVARARQHLREEVMAMMDESFKRNKLPEEFTKETMQVLLEQLAATDDPFAPSGLDCLAGQDANRQAAQVASGIGELLEKGETIERAFLLTGALSHAAICFVRFARLTGRSEGLTIAGELLKTGLMQSESPVSRDDVAAFCAYLSCMLQAGIPIVQAFRMSGKRFTTLAELSSEAAIEARSGNSIAGAFATRSAIFTEPFTRAIRLLESTGHLDDGLAVLAALLWEPNLLDTSQVGGRWEERMELARRHVSG